MILSFLIHLKAPFGHTLNDADLQLEKPIAEKIAAALNT